MWKHVACLCATSATDTLSRHVIKNSFHFFEMKNRVIWIRFLSSKKTAWKVPLKLPVWVGTNLNFYFFLQVLQLNFNLRFIIEHWQSPCLSVQRIWVEYGIEQVTFYQIHNGPFWKEKWLNPLNWSARNWWSKLPVSKNWLIWPKMERLK